MPNGRSAVDTKAAGNDDRTFRDKPFSTIGPIFDPEYRRGRGPRNLGKAEYQEGNDPGRVVAGGILKPKDLCLIPFRLVIALQENGWWIRSRCIWGKPNGMPDSSGKYRPSVAHEEIFLLSKSGDIFYDAESVCAPAGKSNSRVAKSIKMPDAWDTGQGAHGSFHRNGREKGKMKQDGHGRRHAGFNERYFGRPGVTPKSAEENTNIRSKGSYNASLVDVMDTRYLRTYEPEVWHIPTVGFSDAHFATFAPALVERCIMASCPKDGVVLDPFGGSGTVGLVADAMQRDAVLIELNEEYATMAQRRIQARCGVVVDPKPQTNLRGTIFDGL